MNIVIHLFERRPQGQRLYLLYSDNFDGTIVSETVLRELQLQMSTGDYACHMAVPIYYNEATELCNMRGDSMLLTLDDLEY